VGGISWERVQLDIVGQGKKILEEGGKERGCVGGLGRVEGKAKMTLNKVLPDGGKCV